MAFPNLTGRRVALFTGSYNHIADGVALTLNRLVGHLEAHGLNVRVFGPTIPEPAVKHTGTLVPVPSVSAPGRGEYRLSLGLTRGVRAQVEAFRPELVHIATPDLLGLGALRWARKQGLPVVATYHTHFSSYLKYYRLERLEGLLWRYLRWFYGQCTHIYVPSPSMEAVLRQHGIRQGLHLWERGVNVERFTPTRRSDVWRAETMGAAPDEVVVAYIGRLVWEKAVDLFADVIQALEARGVAHRSLVVGDGPALADLRARLPHTTFTGYLGGTDLAQAYASADVFFFPSDTETFGNVTLEAMASGLPTVCADATGSKTLVVNGETGFLAPSGDREAFREAVERLVVDHDLRAHLGAAALARAQTFAWPVILDKMLRYYGAVLDPQ
ncbi:MAG: glycosyltransferase family 1 protein [Bacteroidota bacterium]